MRQKCLLHYCATSFLFLHRRQQVDLPERLAQTRSVLGLFAVPARYYPWMLLVIWQLLVPGVSFLGHLGGVAAGQAYAWGWLRWAMPPASAFQVKSRATFRFYGAWADVLKFCWSCNKFV